MSTRLSTGTLSTCPESIFVQSEVIQQPIRNKDHRSGVCLEYLKGACSKIGTCPFSHALKDYYAHVCKQKPYMCINSCSVSEAVFRGGERTCRHPSHVHAAASLKRLYTLRCTMPDLFEHDQQQAEAIMCVLVRSFLPEIRTWPAEFFFGILYTSWSSPAYDDSARTFR